MADDAIEPEEQAADKGGATNHAEPTAEQQQALGFRLQLDLKAGITLAELNSRVIMLTQVVSGGSRMLPEMDWEWVLSHARLVDNPEDDLMLVVPLVPGTPREPELDLLPRRGRRRDFCGPMRRDDDAAVDRVERVGQHLDLVARAIRELAQTVNTKQHVGVEVAKIAVALGVDASILQRYLTSSLEPVEVTLPGRAIRFERPDVRRRVAAAQGKTVRLYPNTRVLPIERVRAQVVPLDEAGREAARECDARKDVFIPIADRRTAALIGAAIALGLPIDGDLKSATGVPGLTQATPELCELRNLGELLPVVLATLMGTPTPSIVLRRPALKGGQPDLFDEPDSLEPPA